MPTLNSSNQNFLNNADGFTFGGGSSSLRNFTLSGSDIIIVGGGAFTHTLPSVTDTLVSRTSTDTLTNKIINNQSLLRNYSTADQTINAATTALLTGSLITVPTGKLQIGTVFQITLSLSKTAAGTAANTFNFRIGTNGTTADPSICAFALPVGTAVVDVGRIDVMVTIRGPLSASCIAQGNLRMTHNLQTTGLATIAGVCINTTSGTFDATAANLKASLSCTTAASTVLTFQQVVTEVINL